ncbi:MAG: fluoride efflux transporter CrcB [Verrucomicrobiaceae bacterium]|jgi:CrcB protein|nr:fluoride efflux transporter CrcB [Verrucomicrobiaceae bacterium]
MRSLFLVFLGGGIGSVMRHLTVLGVARLLPRAEFPWGVFVANIAGSFILGFLCVLPVMKAANQDAWLLAATGFLGGYTTFSTLANNSWLLFENGSVWLAVMNAFGSVLTGVVAAALGWHCGRVVCGG